MREILFRGKDSKNEWLFGEFALDCMDKVCINTAAYNGYKYLYEVDPETVGQYTGLKDKNGKRIFDGDIVKRCFFYYAVRFGSYNENPENCAPAYITGWHLEYLKSDNVPVEKHTSKIFDIDGTAAKYPAHVTAPSVEAVLDLLLEVIGNIHDNPELLYEEWRSPE